MTVSPLHVHPIVVPASAIDANGHASNIEYVRWMQEAATAHSTAAGWDMERYRRTGTTWVIRSHRIDYLRPAFAGERVAVVTWIAGWGEGASPRRYLFWRPRDRKVLTRAETQWVYVDAATGRPTPIPDAFRAAFTTVEHVDPASLPALVGD